MNTEIRNGPLTRQFSPLCVKIVWERDQVTTTSCYFTDTTLDKLPLRKSDGARVIDTARNVSRIYCKPSGITYLKRYVVMDVKTIKKKI